MAEKKDRSRERIEKLNEHWKNILNDPNLFENIIKELGNKIVGEEKTCKVIVLCAYGGRLVENAQTASFNLLVNDDAGTGKDYVTEASLSLLPEVNCIKKSRISPTVLNYWHNSKDEPEWTWDGKVLYLEDISQIILNHDVFKVMCSSGSSATVVKDQKVIDLEVNGKPVIVITTASAIPNSELIRRFVIVNLDSSVDQTKEVMKRHASFRKIGKMPKLNIQLKDAMQLLNQVSVRIPFSDLITQHFPYENVIMRTHFPRFLDFIMASAALHQFQRKKKNSYVVAEGRDYDIARECFLKICSNKFMIPLTINQKKILQIFENEPALEGTYSNLHVTKMPFMSDKGIGTNLSILVKYGLLESIQKSNEYNREVTIYRLPDSYIPNEKITIPTYEELCRISSNAPISSDTSNDSTDSSLTITSTTSKGSNNKNFLKGGSKEEGKQGKDWKQYSGETVKQIREIDKVQKEFS